MVNFPFVYSEQSIIS